MDAETYQNFYAGIEEEEGLRHLLNRFLKMVPSDFRVNSSHPVNSNSITIREGNRQIEVSTELDKRGFHLTYWEDGHHLASGWGGHPFLIARTLHELLRYQRNIFDVSHDFSWLKMSESSAALFGGIEGFVQRRWVDLQKETRDEHLAGVSPHEGWRQNHQALLLAIETARQHPQLGQFYPFVSWTSLQFSFCTQYRYEIACPGIFGTITDGIPVYKIWSYHPDFDDLKFEGDLKRILEFIAGHIRKGGGPIRFGPWLPNQVQP